METKSPPLMGRQGKYKTTEEWRRARIIRANEWNDKHKDKVNARKRALYARKTECVLRGIED